MHLSCTVFELQRVIRQKWQSLTYPTCVWCPDRGDPIQISPWSLAAETRVHNHFDTILGCDRHRYTHTQTDTHDNGIYCTSIASCGKKNIYASIDVKKSVSTGDELLKEISSNDFCLTGLPLILQKKDVYRNRQWLWNKWPQRMRLQFIS